MQHPTKARDSTKNPHLISTVGCSRGNLRPMWAALYIEINVHVQKI